MKLFGGPSFRVVQFGYPSGISLAQFLWGADIWIGKIPLFKVWLAVLLLVGWIT